VVMATRMIGTSMERCSKMMSLPACQLVNATITALRGEYSRSHVEAQAIMSRPLGFLNVTTSRLEGSKLNSTQYSKATDLLSEARQSLNLAQQYLDKAPDEFRSGNYPIAVRLVHNALRAIQEAQARIGDADMLISESVSTSGKIPGTQGLTTEGAFMLVVFVVISSVIIAILVKRRRGRLSPSVDSMSAKRPFVVGQLEGHACVRAILICYFTCVCLLLRDTNPTAATDTSTMMRTLGNSGTGRENVSCAQLSGIL